MPNSALHTHTHTLAPENPELWGTRSESAVLGTGTQKYLTGAGSVPLCSGKCHSSRSLGPEWEGGNLYKTYMCGFYTEPFSGSKNTTKDSPVRLSIQSYWNGGAHICSGSLMLGTWPRSHRCVIITLLFDWMTLRGNRKVVAVHLFHSLLGWVCYILYRLVPESQPSLDTVSVLVWM